MKNFYSLFLIIILLVLSGCKDNPVNTKQDLEVGTSKNIYLIDELIYFQIKNLSAQSAHIASCCSSIAFYLDKKENDTWVEFRSYGLPCLAMCPGYELFLNINEVRSSNFTTDSAGTFRIRIPYTLSDSYDFDKEVVSNTFMIQ